jgi:hypothetical protein
VNMSDGNAASRSCGLREFESGGTWRRVRQTLLKGVKGLGCEHVRRRSSYLGVASGATRIRGTWYSMRQTIRKRAAGAVLRAFATTLEVSRSCERGRIVERPRKKDAAWSDRIA